MGGNGGGGGNSVNSTRDVGCGGLWRDAVEMGQKWGEMGKKWDELPIFRVSFSPF